MRSWLLQNLSSLFSKESVVLAEMTNSAKLFKVFIICVQKKYFLISLNYAPWFYNLDAFQNWLVSYLPVNILRTSIILPLERVYFNVGNSIAEAFLYMLNA